VTGRQAEYQPAGSNFLDTVEAEHMNTFAMSLGLLYNEIKLIIDKREYTMQSEQLKCGCILLA
jgi:hypothetical protein